MSTKPEKINSTDKFLELFDSLPLGVWTTRSELEEWWRLDLGKFHWRGAEMRRQEPMCFIKVPGYENLYTLNRIKPVGEKNVWYPACDAMFQFKHLPIVEVCQQGTNNIVITEKTNGKSIFDSGEAEE